MARNTVTAEYWQKQHEQALRAPRAGHELALVQLYKGLHEYAEEHRQRYESTIGEDGVLGDGFADICRGFLTLLNGNAGRLDCGTLDAGVRNLCHDNNVEGIE